MNWEAIGALGELLGAVGVIVTLVYLAHQVRLNTRATRLATSQSVAAASREWNRPLLNDPDLAWIFQVGTEDPSKLGEKDYPRFIELCFSLFRMFEDAHYQYQQGALDPDIWNGYKELYLAYAKAPGFAAYWEQRKDTFRPAFRRLIDSSVTPEVLTWGAIERDRRVQED